MTKKKMGQIYQKKWAEFTKKVGWVDVGQIDAVARIDVRWIDAVARIDLGQIDAVGRIDLGRIGTGPNWLEALPMSHSLGIAYRSLAYPRHSP